MATSVVLQTTAILLGSVLAGARALAAPSGETDAKWNVYVEDGESGVQEVDLLPATTPLEHYEENLARVSPEFETRPGDTDKGAFDPANISVTEIGPWNEYVVYDLRNEAEGHRSIVIRDSEGNHRILYAQYGKAIVSDDNAPCLVTVQDHTILVYLARIQGAGSYLFEYYFLIDPTTRRPSRLTLEPIESKLKEVLPEGRVIWRSGGFDIANLRYEQDVWKRGDANCCPTAGRVSMKFEIQNQKLVVTEAAYNPSHRAP